MSAAWLRLQGVRVFDAHGRPWDPAQLSLRSWRRLHPLPHRLVELAGAERGDPWPGLARQLFERGVWHCHSALGRCLQHKGIWALLWPLAGRDLIASYAAQHGRTLDVAGLIEELHWFGHLAAPAGLAHETHARTCEWPRADGRVFTVLPVNPAFLLTCGVLTPDMPVFAGRAHVA